MQTLQFQPFNREELIAKLKEKFPTYIIRKIPFGGIQVRTKKFTITGNVELKVNEQTGKIKVSTFLDWVALYFLFCIPMGIYILCKNKTIAQNQKKVVDALNEILSPH